MAVFTGNDHKGKSQKERIQEITAQLEAGVLAVFESDVYRAYLKCMSKLYSFWGYLHRTCKQTNIPPRLTIDCWQCIFFVE